MNAIERNRELIEALYAATGAGDWAAAEEMLHDDFVAVEADSMPYAGTYSGKKGLRELFEKVMSFWSDPSLDIHAITVGETAAVGLLTMHATVRATGERLAIPIAEAFHFKDGKVTRIVPYYYDTHAVVRATTPKAA